MSKRSGLPPEPPTASTETEAEKQARIRLILADRSKSGQEKQAEISRIMRGDSPGAAALSEGPATVPSATPCEHYPDKLCGNFFFACCNVYDHCHRCHKEIYTECKLFPPNISTVQCSKCKTTQPPSQTCSNTECATQFCRSYCDTCKIWSSKDMIHCEKCGICRVGKEGEIFHCDPCGACFMEASRASHVCTGRSSVDTQCHFCFEYVHHSQTPVVTLPCNHMVHEHCAKKALGSNCYRCPVCRSAMVNMQDYWDGISVQIDIQPMPEEYRRECKIDCFDCHKQSTTNFHFLGLMCPLCRGYNTSEA